MRSLVVLPLCAVLAGCGFSHINKDTSRRPETAIGSAARVIMPGDPLPSAEHPQAEQETVMLGGSSTDADQSVRQRDVPLGPLATLFGYPFWIFCYP